MQQKRPPPRITPQPVLSRHQDQTSQHDTHCGRDRDRPSAHSIESEAPGRPPCAQKHVQTLQR